MRQVMLVAIASLLLLSGGCGPRKPMTESEFRGFCYQYGEGSNGKASCDTIAVCTPYTAVMNTRQESLKACLAECQRIYAPQSMTYVLTECQGPAQFARDWCQRYCRTAYPE